MRLNGPRVTTRQALPDPAELHVELRKPGVTLQLLHLEYLERRRLSVHDVAASHRSVESRAPTHAEAANAGDKNMFIPYSGKRPHYIECDGRGRRGGVFVAFRRADEQLHLDDLARRRLDVVRPLARVVDEHLVAGDGTCRIVGARLSSHL